MILSKHKSINLDNSDLQIVVKDVSKSYFAGDVETKALNKINLEVKKGSFKLILGPSGSGKSTLMNVIGGLDTPDTGKILVNYGKGDFKNIQEFTSKELTLYRRKYVGIIFQFYNLIPILTALENIELAARLSSIANAKMKSINLLNELGLEGKHNRYPNQLSGGEQQRVAIARALIKDPVVILADEPTGNLDYEKTNEIYRILRNFTDEYKKTILVVTHDEEMAKKYAESYIHIRDGIIIENIENNSEAEK
ncbi:MAG: ABC transporter ATP-binding protein [Promethearchaeota archaeon]